MYPNNSYICENQFYSLNYKSSKQMEKLIYLLAICACISGCSNKKNTSVSLNDETLEAQNTQPEQTWYEGEKPFIFNEKEEYPETNIKLSELATLSYIPLGTDDKTIIMQRGACTGNEYIMTSDRIYMHEEQAEIYIFKTDGTPIKKINHKGGGPEEYSSISSFAIDTLQNELFVQDAHRKQTLVYDLDGNFKRKLPNLAKEIVLLNDSLLLNFFQYNPRGPRYSVVRKSDGSNVLNLHIRFNVNLPHDSWGRLAYGSLIKSPNGAFLSNLGNDTIFEIRKDLNVTPRIIDISDYGTNFAQVHPTIETGRYLMFYILRCHTYKPLVYERFYIYDKKEKQTYKMSDYPGNSYWTLMDDYPHINNWTTTQNCNIAIRSRLVSSLFEAEGKHGDAELKALINKLDEDANPVLQVMTFHDVDEVKK